MSTSPESLQELMRQELSEGGCMVSGGRELYMEVVDTQTGLIWMGAEPIQSSDFEALQLDENLARVMCGLASMDRAAFQHSPGAPGKPVRKRMIDGHLFINVAEPLERIPPAEPGEPMEISVNKAHVIGFKAGRMLTILTLPEGDFVEVIGEPDEDDTRILPVGGKLRKIELTESLVISLPTPTRTFFWFDEAMRSFQGPVELPEST